MEPQYQGSLRFVLFFWNISQVETPVFYSFIVCIDTEE